jgi:hypothetical protein
MVRTKQPSKRKRGRRGVPALGAAGVSLVMAGGASANAPTANVPSLRDTPPRPVAALDEEEIADVSLATFYIFDKENLSHLGQGIRLAAKGWLRRLRLRRHGLQGLRRRHGWQGLRQLQRLRWLRLWRLRRRLVGRGVRDEHRYRLRRRLLAVDAAWLGMGLLLKGITAAKSPMAP